MSWFDGKHPTWGLALVSMLVALAAGYLLRDVFGGDDDHPGVPTIPVHVEAHGPVAWEDHAGELLRVRDVEEDILCWYPIDEDGRVAGQWCSPAWAIEEPEDDGDE